MPSPEPRQPLRVSREHLYGEVWTEPVTTVAKCYGISGVAFSKACRKLGVPLPKRGHWAKVAAGQTVERAPLPPAAKGQPVEYTFGATPQIAPALPPDMAAKVAGQGVGALVVVPDVLVKPHLLVVEASKLLKAADKDQYGLLTVRGQPCLDILVTKAALPRALRLMDALLKSLELAGHSVRCVTEPRRSYERGSHLGSRGQTLVKLGEETIPIAIEEEIKLDPRPARPPAKDVAAYEAWLRAPAHVRRPTGRLAVIMRDQWSVGRTRWIDGKRKQLEQVIGEFFCGLLQVAEALKQRRLEHKEWARIQGEKAAREREAAEAQRRQQERRQALDKMVQDWKVARDIRAFVEAARARQAPGSERGDDVVEDWLAWAVQRADEIDPLRNLKHESGRAMFGHRPASFQRDSITDMRQRSIHE